MYVLVDPSHMFLSDFKHVFVDIRQFLLLLTLIPLDFLCMFLWFIEYMCVYIQRDSKRWTQFRKSICQN